MGRRRGVLFSGGRGSIISVTKVAEESTGSPSDGSGNYDLGTISIGTAPAAGQKRAIIICFGGVTSGASGNDMVFNSASLGGVTMDATAITSNDSAAASASTAVGYIASVPTGTTASLTIDYTVSSDTLTGTLATVYSVLYTGRLTLYDFDTDQESATVTATLDHTKESVAFVSMGSRNASNNGFGGDISITTGENLDLSTSEYFRSGASGRLGTDASGQTITNDNGGVTESHMLSAAVFAAI